MKYFNGRIPSEAVIRDQSRQSWHVTLEELKNVVFFKDGWQEFVESHLLKLGDFLVFQYDGSHMFDVKIFSKNGCKKERVSRTGCPCAVVKVKDEPQSEHNYSTSLTRCKRSDSEVRSTDSSGDKFSPHFCSTYISLPCIDMYLNAPNLFGALQALPLNQGEDQHQILKNLVPLRLQNIFRWNHQPSSSWLSVGHITLL